MGYESLKYNFILKNMLKTAFGLSEWNRMKPLDKLIKLQIQPCVLIFWANCALCSDSAVWIGW
jgi:hypothetical protein